ncbi:unnamed protein product [Amoebophrya sp. A120]|nr:unnamed protein product [Amoebophrya sp. A120]|eukprot:GSA120T00015619001.1
MAENQLPFLRITVIGLGNSGKTSLINSYVNKHCPTVYQETSDPVLYYKTMKLQSEDDEDSKSAFRALLEIEDTYSSFRGDGKSYGVPRDIKLFLDMTREEDSKLKQQLNLVNIAKKGTTRPFASYICPRADQYRPLTKGRMGFLIVFDANETKSYEEALNLHSLLLDDLKRKKIKLEPVVYLVANKIDKDPHSDTFCQIIASAELYSKEKMIRFWQVSSMEFVRVKKMFREMVSKIRSNQILWLVDDGPAVCWWATPGLFSLTGSASAALETACNMQLLHEQSLRLPCGTCDANPGKAYPCRFRPGL